MTSYERMGYYIHPDSREVVEIKKGRYPDMSYCYFYLWNKDIVKVKLSTLSKWINCDQNGNIKLSYQRRMKLIRCIYEYSNDQELSIAGNSYKMDRKILNFEEQQLVLNLATMKANDLLEIIHLYQKYIDHLIDLGK